MRDVAAFQDTKGGRSPARAYLLSLPALLLFLGIVVVPIIMTVMLSFYIWNRTAGIQATFVLDNWREVIDDSYFHETFLRTFRLSALVTVFAALLGTPEAYIPTKLSRRWRRICLLVILGPLLVSVVARTLGRCCSAVPMASLMKG
jgi:putative spermidine/putrescine transport system permease protein